MAIKLIAIDMDGTLLNEQHQISEAVKYAICAARQQGVSVVLATGRPYIGVKPYLQQLGMCGDNDYCITYNGAAVQRAASGIPIIEHTLTYADYCYFEEIARRTGVDFQAFDYRYLYTPNQAISHYTIRESYLTGIQVYYCSPEQMNKDIAFLKFMMVDEPQILDHAIRQIPQQAFERFNLLKSADFYFEILSKQVNKGISLAELAQRLAIEQDQVMAIGDHGNDVAMLEFAGIGVAMGNAIDEVKQVSQYVTKTNDEDGVAHAIEQFVLKG